MKKARFISDGLSEIVTQDYDSRQIIVGLYKLLSDFLPIDTMSIPVINPVSGLWNYKAFVLNKKAIFLDETIKLSDEGKKAVEEIKNNTILIINNSSENIISREVVNYFGIKDLISTLSIFVKSGKSRFVALLFAAYGTNRYKTEHIDLLTPLTDSLAKILHRLLFKMQEINEKKRLISENPEISTVLKYHRIDLVLNSQAGLRDVMGQIEHVAPLDSPVLITGETGVGKELVADAVHGASKRVDGPLVSVNCGAIPESLLDSELFGFEKGAFTGAGQMRQGYFEQADKGSLFLDEIGELSLQAQVKLLRALQNKTIQRVGASKTISVDVLVIAATNRDLVRTIKEGSFRPDLWYRLNVFPIEVPPLRKRKKDIPTLVQYLINSKLFEMNLPFTPSLGPHAMAQLLGYDWPGNVRELQNIIERGLILCRGKPLSFPNLGPNSPGDATLSPDFSEVPFPSMAQMMTRHIQNSLELSGGKIDGVGGAAELLHMNPSTLRARMKKLGIKISRIALKENPI